MLRFKYSTRIPLVHDASIMVFPLLEWCVQLWPAPLSLSLKSQRERGRKRPGKHNQNNFPCAEDLHTRQGRGAGAHRGPRGALCLGEQQATGKLAAQGWGSASRRVPGLGVKEFGLSLGLLLFSLCLGMSLLTLWGLSTEVGGTLTGCLKVQV